MQFQAGVQCVRKFCSPRAKWTVPSFPRARQSAMPVCLCVYTWMHRCTRAAMIWWGLCACDVGRGQPFANMEDVKQETHRCVKGNPQGMWDFSLLEEMGVFAGKPHGAEPHHQC